MKTIVIDGEPIGKGRPRFGNGHTFTPKRTRDYEEYVRECYIAQHGDIFDEEPIDVTIRAYHKIPESKPLRFRRAAKLGLELPTKKPDIDNELKIILDSLSGVAFPDDKWVVRVEVTKEFSEEPRVEIEIKSHFEEER